MTTQHKIYRYLPSTRSNIALRRDVAVSWPHIVVRLLPKILGFDFMNIYVLARFSAALFCYWQLPTLAFLSYSLFCNVLWFPRSRESLFGLAGEYECLSALLLWIDRGSVWRYECTSFFATCCQYSWWLLDVLCFGKGV